MTATGAPGTLGPVEEQPDRVCRIEQELGRRERCPKESCPFWRPGDGAVSGFCEFEKLDLRGRRDLVIWLHDLRAGLASSSAAARDDARRAFAERLNAGRAD
jgi:hypothetical protein